MRSFISRLPLGGNWVLFALLLAFCAQTSLAQSTYLIGKVLDGKEPLFGASVKALRGTETVRGATSDMDGNFRLSLDPGTYSIAFGYTGFQPQQISNVVVLAGKVNVLPDVIMTASTVLSEVVISGYTVPLIERDNTSGGQTITSHDIKKLPTRNTDKKVKASERKTAIDGGDVNIKGSRSNATNYYVDGVKVSGKKKPVGEINRPPAPPASKPLPDGIIMVDGRMKRMQIAFEPETYEEKVILVDVENDEISGYTDSIPREQYTAEQYNTIVENPFQDARSSNISTFSIDVDAASYSNIRHQLNSGYLPPKDAVRIEEMINYFDYQYTAPAGAHPFEANVEVAPCPWNPGNRLMVIGLQGATMDVGQLPASNFVFLIDVSGSMSSENKLPLVQQSLVMLTEHLRANDRVAIVVYAGAAGLVLESTAGTDKTKIKNAIENLNAGGSTAGGAGIKLAYDTARKNLVPGGNNRVVLCTDGDFNVGLSSEDELVKLIEQERESGVYLSVLGFGDGNYQDGKMQTLADKGNGNHAYIDQLAEAKKVLIKEFGGTLFAIAKDVKLQLHFNPELVAGYRLIGYENRLLATEDFNDDTKDAGELGMGHRVTALYEIVPKGQQLPALSKLDSALVVSQKPDKAVKIDASDLMVLQLRYKKPTGNAASQLMEYRLNAAALDRKTESDNFKLAAGIAEFGMLLRDSKYKGAATYTHALTTVRAASTIDANGYRAELATMIELAGKLAGQLK